MRTASYGAGGAITCWEAFERHLSASGAVYAGDVDTVEMDAIECVVRGLEGAVTNGLEDGERHLLSGALHSWRARLCARGVVRVLTAEHEQLCNRHAAVCR